MLLSKPKSYTRIWNDDGCQPNPPINNAPSLTAGSRRVTLRDGLRPLSSVVLRTCHRITPCTVRANSHQHCQCHRDVRLRPLVPW